MKIVEAAVDAALAEVRRQGGPEYLLTEARSEGLAAAKALETALFDRICFLIGQTHDTSDLWSHMRRDPEAFRAAVRAAMNKRERPMSPSTTTSSGLSLVAGHFEAPPFVVPNARGEAFKIEQVVERGPDRTVKLVWWFLPDDDRHPHNHPWAFDSDILAGGYTSVTYWLVNGQIKTEERVARAGDRVHYPRHEYHVVKDVLPDTRTRMTCGPAAPNNAWGYLDPATGREYPWQEQADTAFMDRMLALNPWRRLSDDRTSMDSGKPEQLPRISDLRGVLKGDSE